MSEIGEGYKFGTWERELVCSSVVLITVERSSDLLSESTYFQLFLNKQVDSLRSDLSNIARS